MIPTEQEMQAAAAGLYVPVPAIKALVEVRELTADQLADFVSAPGAHNRDGLDMVSALRNRDWSTAAALLTEISAPSDQLATALAEACQRHAQGT